MLDTVSVDFTLGFCLDGVLHIRAALLGGSFGSEFGPKPRRLDGVHPENLANGASHICLVYLPFSFFGFFEALTQIFRSFHQPLLVGPVFCSLLAVPGSIPL